MVAGHHMLTTTTITISVVSEQADGAHPVSLGPNRYFVESMTFHK